MNRETLSGTLTGKGLTPTNARKLVDVFFHVLSLSVQEGKETGIKNFIRFKTRSKAESEFMNNRTKKRMMVPAHRVVQAKFAKNFKELFLTRDKSEGVEN